jgi:hypothetical protein
MTTLQIEHPIKDFDTWKQAFDRDPLDRKGSGVRHYRVLRPIDDPNYIKVDLEFESREVAEVFLESLRGLWQSPQAAPALKGSPRVRFAEEVESVDFR